MPEPKAMNRWLAVVGAVLIQLCLGAIYAWSVFTPGLLQAGWSRLETQVVFSLGLATFAVVMVGAGRKLSLWGPRQLAWLGGALLGLGYTMAGLLGGTNFWVVSLFIGVLGGAGIGLAYVVPIAVGMRWFPDKKGLITGLAVAGFGFGALLWVKLAGAWAGLLATFGLSSTFTIYGLIFAALVLLGGVWMVFPPAGWTPAGYTPPPDAAKSTAATGTTEFSAGRMLETHQFYLIFATFAVSAGAGLMAIGIMKLYPIEALTAAGVDQARASEIAGTAMAVFFSIANGLGRIIWGSVSDKLGRKRSLQIMTTSQGFILIAFTVLAGNEYTLYLGAALIGFNFGGNFALFPTFTADTFGTKRVGQNYPYVFLAYGVGGIVGPILGGQLGDLRNFPLAFTTVGIACILGSGFISLVSPPRRAEVDTLAPEDAEIPAAALALNHRDLTEADARTICGFPESAKELFHMFPSAQPPLTPEHLLRTALQRKSPTVVLSGDEVAGYANFIACEPGGLCSVGNVVVGARFRRHGVGAYLMQVMTDKARSDHHAMRLRASVFNENTAAILFYGRLGFTPAGMEVRQDHDGNDLALLHMEKPLS